MSAFTEAIRMAYMGNGTLNDAPLWLNQAPEGSPYPYCTMLHMPTGEKLAYDGTTYGKHLVSFTFHAPATTDLKALEAALATVFQRVEISVSGATRCIGKRTRPPRSFVMNLDGTNVQIVGSTSVFEFMVEDEP